MCTANCVLWVAKHISPKEIKGKKILEVGSFDVNGSVRPIIELLEPAEYVGTDMRSGPGVDVICAAEQLVDKFGKDRFDIVVSANTLEHVKEWKKAISNIKNVCKPDGTILIIVPSKWPFHEYPYDYWRFNSGDISQIFADCSILSLEEDAGEMTAVYAKIKKPLNFIENNLEDYQAYSVLLKKRVIDIDTDVINKLADRLVRRIDLQRRIIKSLKKFLPIRN